MKESTVVPGLPQFLAGEAYVVAEDVGALLVMRGQAQEGAPDTVRHAEKPSKKKASDQAA